MYGLKVGHALRAVWVAAALFVGAGVEAKVAAGDSVSLASTNEEWIPGPANYSGNWKTGLRFLPMDVAAAPRAQAGVTALSGRILRLDGKPLAGVTLKLDGQEARSDEQGYFLLSAVQAGPRTLVIDGASANRDDARYGFFEVLVDVAAAKTTVLPYHVWMPKLDTSTTVRVPSPTTEEVVLRSPRIPGLEVRIPKGVVLRDRSGNVVEELSITPIPVDRTPFPQPPMEFPVYYTVQPGGVVLESVDGARLEPARVIYPNYAGMPAGSGANAWLYDPFEKGWHIYGQGKVNLAGTFVDLEAGVGLYQFTGGAHDSGAPSGASGAACGGGCGGAGSSGPDRSASGGGASSGGGKGSGGGTATVGTSGNAKERLRPVVKTGRRRPARMCGVAAVMPMMMSGI